MKRIGAAVALVACVVWLAGPASADVDQKFSIDDVTIGEGGVTATFTISLTAGTDPTASVDWATANGSATAGDDYTSSSGSETVDAGSSKTVTVPILQDSVDEENEIFTVTLSNANGATIDDGSGAGTITDDDTSPSLAISGPATRDEAAGTATYNVAVSGTSASTVSVNYSAAGGTATAGTDFSLTPGTLTWNPGDTATKQITVNITNDTLDEDDETYSVNLSSPSGATISTGTANTTITDNDSQPTTGAFASVSTAEGQSGTHELNFTVNLSAASGKAVTINYSTVAGTASAGSDYVAEVNQNITIPAGQTTGTIGIAINGDTVPEPDESFTVNLNNATNATLGADTQATGTITNDDSGVTASINDVTQAEGNGPGTTSFTFTIALSGPAPTASTITWRTADGSATQGSDYNAVGNTTITIAQNATSATVSVSVIGDTAPEPNETFFVDLVGSSGSVSLSADNRGIGTITNDDSGVTASINDVTLAEGNSGTTNFTFTVSLSAPAPAPITITYRTEDGTANAASGDYTAHPNAPLSFATGAQTRTVTVVVNGDVVAEANETFFVDLVGSSGPVTFTDSRGTGTINNDDQNVNATINDVTLAEGNSGTTSFTFTVSLSAPAPAPITINHRTADGTATDANNDYEPIASTPLSFTTGVQTRTITVAVNGDTVTEANETFFVDLIGTSGPVTITDSRGTGTINNDDTNANATITDVTLAEGDAGSKNFVFTVSLSVPAAAAGSITWRTSDGTATHGTDYTGQPTNQTLSFAAGDQTKTITIPVSGDVVPEGNETFFVDLVGSTGPISIADNRGVGTINNDDANVSATINDMTMAEGNFGTVTFTFTVTLSGPAPAPITITWRTEDGTATTANSDYAGLGNTALPFTQGQTTKTITVTVFGDTIPEGDETFFVDLVGSSGPVTITDSRGVARIVNDDVGVAASISDAQVTEGNSDTVNMTFIVSLSAPAPAPLTVAYATDDGSALSPDDYEPVADGLLNFAAGDTTKQFDVVVKGDTIPEGASENFLVVISPTGATVAKGVGIGTINDDDVPPSTGGGGGGTATPPALTISDTVVTEGLQASFTVTMLTSTSKTVTVDFATADGTAKAGSDYTARTGTLTFPPGTSQQTFTVGAILDNENEGAETFHVSLSNPTNATILKSLATATIVASAGIAGPGPGSGGGTTAAALPKMVLGPRSPSVVARGYAIMTITCLKESPIACSGRVDLETTTKPKLKLATKKFTVKKGKVARIHVFLSKRALALLKKKGTLKARAIVFVKNSKRKDVKVVPGVVTLKATAGLMGQKPAAPKTAAKTTPAKTTPKTTTPKKQPEEPLPPIKVEVEP